MLIPLSVIFRSNLVFGAGIEIVSDPLKLCSFIQISPDELKYPVSVIVAVSEFASAVRVCVLLIPPYVSRPAVYDFTDGENGGSSSIDPKLSELRVRS